MSRISLCELLEWQAAGRQFTLLDVRRAGVRLADAAEIAGAQWRDPEALFSWKEQIPRDRPAILYCAQGHEISQGCAATLQAMGLDARYLIDGYAGWHAAGRPTQRLSI
ncbi:rhodanese-like domain-containing protein [Pseudomonas sp. sp1636]|uniref:rhodanese-like domain-containing protein n=1 Tax=Pseudomonas sp. sp1636 TaxID=3036707 RepID=UPI0025A581C9|nr:rhodanese-like domain-containing protein [Pseudomonas sp. sp1636]MDM8349006.1 rhodanese-like domain-containing protein [Pseudomonas sp. sp1636]